MNAFLTREGKEKEKNDGEQDKCNAYKQAITECT